MKRKLGMIVALVLIMVVGVTIVAFANANAPGSESDPVVTKSYVDSQSKYTPISLKPGQKLIGGEGTELILRSGEATAIDNGANGISDITAGKDLITGMQVGLNHLLLVPRDDGRGINAITDIWIMVRGTYKIQ